MQHDKNVAKNDRDLLQLTYNQREHFNHEKTEETLDQKEQICEAQNPKIYFCV